MSKTIEVPVTQEHIDKGRVKVRRVPHGQGCAIAVAMSEFFPGCKVLVGYFSFDVVKDGKKGVYRVDPVTTRFIRMFDAYDQNGKPIPVYPFTALISHEGGYDMLEGQGVAPASADVAS